MKATANEVIQAAVVARARQLAERAPTLTPEQVVALRSIFLSKAGLSVYGGKSHSQRQSQLT